MRALYWLIVLAVLFVLGCESVKRALDEMNRPPQADSTVSSSFRPEKYPKIAVITSDQTGHFSRREVQGISRQVEDKFIAELLQKGYTVASRSDVESILGEMRFQSSNLTEDDAARLGRMLNVPAVLLVSITNIDHSQERVQYRDGGSGTVYYAHGSIGARLVGVETAEILWLSSYAGRIRTESSRNEERVLPIVAEIVATSFPSRYSAPSTAPTAAESLSAYTFADLRSIQEFLNSSGYSCGAADGVIGPKTRGCIREFQRDTGIAVTGDLDEATLSEINELASQPQ